MENTSRKQRSQLNLLLQLKNSQVQRSSKGSTQLKFKPTQEMLDKYPMLFHKVKANSSFLNPVTKMKNEKERKSGTAIQPILFPSYVAPVYDNLLAENDECNDPRKYRRNSTNVKSTGTYQKSITQRRPSARAKSTAKTRTSKLDEVLRQGIISTQRVPRSMSSNIRCNINGDTVVWNYHEQRQMLPKEEFIFKSYDGRVSQPDTNNFLFKTQEDVGRKRHSITRKRTGLRAHLLHKHPSSTPSTLPLIICRSALKRIVNDK